MRILNFCFLSHGCPVHVCCRFRWPAVQGVGLQLIDFWDSGSESLVFIVFCVGSGLWDELIARAEEFYWMFVCV